MAVACLLIMRLSWQSRLLLTNCTHNHKCTHAHGFIWLSLCLARSLLMWLPLTGVLTAFRPLAQTLSCACQAQPSVRLHCAAASAKNTVRSPAATDTNMPLTFRLLQSVLLLCASAAHGVCVWIVCVTLHARAHSCVPRRSSAARHRRGSALPWTPSLLF